VTGCRLISPDPIFASIEAHRIVDARYEVILCREPIEGAARRSRMEEGEVAVNALEGGV
jgi:hypothetical protein